MQRLRLRSRRRVLRKFVRETGDSDSGAGAPCRVHTRSGHVDDPYTYYDFLELAAPARKPPVLLIHGGAHTGACYLSTVDGRPGWAYFLAARGYRVIVPDWPGTGRSGYIPPDALTSERVIEGLGKVLNVLQEPAIVVTHSMSGPFGWKLLELYGNRIQRLVAIAPGRPGNIAAKTEILAETPESVELCLVRGGPAMKIDRIRPFIPEPDWARKKLVGDGSQFPTQCVQSYLASLESIPAELLLDRANYAGRSPAVGDFKHYKGKRVAVVVGSNDVEHTREMDEPIVEWLNQNGADAEFIELASHGILGNGHMMMMESNSDEIAAGIVAWVEGGHFSNLS